METFTPTKPELVCAFPVVALLSHLIDHAAAHFETDRKAAREYISRAATLLRAERARRTARLRQSHSTSPLDIVARLSRAGKLDPRRLSRVLEYVHAHLGDALDIRGMASAASLSRFHFARAFKASTGQTPYQYVSAKRLAQAKVLLEQNQPIAEIALVLNFSSQANFTRAFRCEFGITPGRYREQKSRFASQGPPGTQSGAGWVVLSKQLPHEPPPAWDGAARASVAATNDHHRPGRLTPGRQG
jgi:AraC-like DNA-binding protein